MTSKQISITLIILGLVVISLFKMISHYAQLGDIAEGFLMGMGFGLMIVGFLRKRPKSSNSS